MDTLKLIRNRVEDLCYRDLPDGVYSTSVREADTQARATLIEQLLTKELTRDAQDLVLQALVDFLGFQENSEWYFTAERRLVGVLYDFLFVQRGHTVTASRFLRFLTDLREMLQHQRRWLSGPAKPAPSRRWEGVMAKILSVYSDGVSVGYIPSASAAERAETIDELLRLLKEMVFLEPPEGLKEYLLSDLLAKADFLDHLAIDTIDLVFVVLGYFPADEMAGLLVDLASPIWTFYSVLRTRGSPTWFQPRLELYMLTLIAKFETKHWQLEGVQSNLIESGVMRELFAMGMDWVGLPASASSASVDSTSGIETVGLHRQVGTLLNADRRRVAAKMARIAVSMIWSSIPACESLGWRFVELVSLRSQSILLASTTVGSRRGTSGGGDASRWPHRLCELYSSLCHHWLRRQYKAQFLGAAAFADNGRFANLLMPGVANVAKNTYGGGVGPPIATKYVSVFVNLIRIGGVSHDTTETLGLAVETLSDLHKSAIHGMLLLSGLTPAAGVLGRFGSETSASTFQFLLDFAIDGLDTTNLIKTVSVLGYLDVLLTQVPHGWTLRDLSLDAHAGSSLDKSLFLNLSSTFPDWSCRLLEKLLTVQLPKPKALSVTAVAALSSEGLEVIGRVLTKEVWTWVVSNVDDSVLIRFTSIFQDYIASNWSSLPENGRTGLVGNLLTRLMQVRFSQELVEWLLARVNLADLAARGNAVWISLVGHAIRFAGNNATQFIPRIEKIATAVLTAPDCPFSVRKSTLKLVQRLLGSACLFYLTEQRSYYTDKFANSQLLLDRIGKSGIDVDSAWWRDETASAGWHVPTADSVGPSVRLAEQLLTLVEGGESQLFCRLVIAISKSIVDGYAIAHIPSLITFNRILKAKLTARSASAQAAGDVKTTTMWIKAVRMTLPRPVGREQDGGLSIVLRELCGFRVENLQEFGFIGKEYEALDETRFEYLGTKLLGVLDSVRGMRLSQLGMGAAELGLVEVMSSMVLHSQFDKVKVSAILALKDSIEVASAGPARTAIIIAILDAVTAVLAVGPLSKHAAQGVSLLINICHEIGHYIMADARKCVQLFELLSRHLTQPGIEPDIMEPLMGVFRDVWNDRVRLRAQTPHLDDPNDLHASEFIRTSLTNLAMATDMYWKAQVTTLAMCFTVWRYHCLANPPLVAFVWDHLSNLLARGDVTPLAAAMRTFIVFWMEMLLLVEPGTVRGVIKPATAGRIAKIFSLTRRFESAGRARSQDLVDVITAQIVSDETQLNLFANVKTPKLSNKGIVEANVVFWYILLAHPVAPEPTGITRQQVIDVVSSLLTDTSDDDVHCTVLELYAAIMPHLESDAEWDQFFAFLRMEIARGDGSLVPTVATAVRIGITGRGAPSVEPRSQVHQTIPALRSVSTLGIRIFNYLTGDLIASGHRADASMLSSRLLLVLNNALLVDFDLIHRLDFTAFRPYLMKSCLDGSTNEQIRDIAGSALARLVFVEGTEASLTEQSIQTRVQAMLATVPVPTIVHPIGEELLNHTMTSGGKMDEKVATLRLVTRFVKYRRALPEWFMDVVHLALDCVGSAKEEVKTDGGKFLSLVARFIKARDAVSVASHVELALENPKQKEALIELAVDASVNAVTRADSSLWTCESGAIPDVLIEHFIEPVQSAMFSQLVHSPIRIDESTNPVAVTACKNALVDLYVLVPSAAIPDKLLRPIRQPTSVAGVLELSSLVVVSSLFYQVPQWGVEAVGRLARAISIAEVAPNVKRIGQSALAEFLKSHTDRGTRDKTDRLFDSDVLSLVRSGKGRHSYIS